MPQFISTRTTLRRCLVGCSLIGILAFLLTPIAPAQTGPASENAQSGQTQAKQKGKRARRAAARKSRVPKNGDAKKGRKNRRAAVPKPPPVVVLGDALTVPTKDVLIVAPTSGKIAEILVSEGDHIDSESKVAKLDDREAILQLSAAKSALSSSLAKSTDKLEIEAARQELALLETRFQKGLDANKVYEGVVSEGELEELRLQMNTSALNVRRAERDRIAASADSELREFEMSMAVLRAERHQIKTPIHGIVVRVDATPGQWVEKGRPICRVIATDPIRIDCMVPAEKAESLETGGEVQFAWNAASGPQRASGKIGFISPERDPVNGQVLIRAIIDNRDGKLRTGLVGKLQQTR